LSNVQAATRAGPPLRGNASFRHHPQDRPRGADLRQRAAHSSRYKKTGTSGSRQCLSDPAPPAGLEPATRSLTRLVIPLIEDVVCITNRKALRWQSADFHSARMPVHSLALVAFALCNRLSEGPSDSQGGPVESGEVPEFHPLLSSTRHLNQCQSIRE
jgi:hypothetical protein